MGMAALQDEFPGARGEEQSALLLDHGDALRAGARRKRVSDESVEQNPSGKGRKRAGDQLQQGGFAAGVWPKDGDDFAGFGLKTCRFQREERGLRRICGMGVTDLLNAEADVGGQARRFGRIAREGRAAAHASLLRRRYMKSGAPTTAATAPPASSLAPTTDPATRPPQRTPSPPP